MKFNLVSICICDLINKFVYLNESLCEIFGIYCLFVAILNLFLIVRQASQKDVCELGRLCEKMAQRVALLWHITVGDLGQQELGLGNLCKLLN